MRMLHCEARLPHYHIFGHFEQTCPESRRLAASRVRLPWPGAAACCVS